MSFSNLKRQQCTLQTEFIDTDTFIAQAEQYALGGLNVVDIRQQKEVKPSLAIAIKDKKIRATYCLSKEAKETLDAFAINNNISRSRLVRIWLSTLTQNDIDELYLSSSID